MANFTVEITLENEGDSRLVEAGLLQKPRSMTVSAMPDTGSWFLVIDEGTRQQLGLKVVDSVNAVLSDGSVSDCGLTDSVIITWENRATRQQAMVLPKADDILLGALPLEAMDLTVDPVGERLFGAHGDGKPRGPCKGGLKFRFREPLPQS